MENEPVLTAWKSSAEDLDFQEPGPWYKGEHCHRYPTDRAVTVEDILRGWAPPQKFITSDTKVQAFGSCFAEYFVAFLASAGYNRWQIPPEQHGLCPEEKLFTLGSTFENIFVILQQFRWAFSEFTPQSRLWFMKDKRYFEATEERREKLRQVFQEVDVFVITLGLSEIWRDQISGEPMWRTIPSKLYEPGRHVCRIATVAETVGALYEFDRLIDRFLPRIRVIFTLSPIPLEATFRDQSPITANQASKAVLRAALDQFFADDAMRAKRRYHYFPSYELAFHLFDRPFLPDNRHVRPDVAKAILEIFSAMYTDLPVPEQETPGRNYIDLLEDQLRKLEFQLEEKEQMIQELAREANQRLELLNRLSAERESRSVASGRAEVDSKHP